MEVKQLLGDSPALALFNPSLRPVISTDASDYELGAVFAQTQPDGREGPVAFTIRTLTETEQKYSRTEEGALACVWAADGWRTYLWGRCFTLRTDHQALATPLSTKGIDRAGMRIAGLHACSILIMMSFTVQVHRTTQLIACRTYPCLGAVTPPRCRT